MPFTFSHPAIVMPLAYLPKRYRSITGLVVGSIVPDFEKFLRMQVYDSFSHTLPAIFYFNLPFGIFLAFVFHLVVREPLIDNLPPFLRIKCAAYSKVNWITAFKTNAFIIIMSLLIGIISHLGWDSFTHTDGYFVQMIPGFLRQVKVLGIYSKLPVIVDRISTLVGLLVILFIILKTSFKNSSLKPEYYRKEYWLKITFLASYILIIRMVNGINEESFEWDFIVSAISASLLSLTFVSGLVKFNIRH